MPVRGGKNFFATNGGLPVRGGKIFFRDEWGRGVAWEGRKKFSQRRGHGGTLVAREEFSGEEEGVVELAFAGI